MRNGDEKRKKYFARGSVHAGRCHPQIRTRASSSNVDAETALASPMRCTRHRRGSSDAGRRPRYASVSRPSRASPSVDRPTRRGDRSQGSDGPGRLQNSEPPERRLGALFSDSVSTDEIPDLFPSMVLSANSSNCEQNMLVQTPTHVTYNTTSSGRPYTSPLEVSASP